MREPGEAGEPSARARPQPVVRVERDLLRLDGTLAEVRGEYQPVPRPMRRVSATKGAPTFAVVMLEDGTHVYLEPNDAPSAEPCAPGERAQFAGKHVIVHGVVHRYMPSKGQSLLAPCVSGVDVIELDASEQ